MQGITPFLWFDGDAAVAAEFYRTVFPDSQVVHTARAQGRVVSVTFTLQGQRFIALNGGPQYAFTPAVSFLVSCETQDEVDTLWSKLVAGGEPQPCGWLRDRFGLSWQVIPTALGRLLHDPDPVRAQRVMHAMLQMTKIDIAGLERAHAEVGTA